MSAPSTKLVIKRSEWDRGHREDVWLRHPDHGKMCCLGFDAKRRGYTDAEITGVKTPGALLDAGLPDKGYIADGWLKEAVGTHNHSDDCSRVMRDNDLPEGVIPGTKLPESQREEWVAAFFKRYGIEVEFVD